MSLVRSRHIVLAMLFAGASHLAAQTPGAPEKPGKLDPAAVADFVDQHFQSALEATGAPGAMVAIVQGEDTILLRGYGTRDLETGEPVDPDRTLYRLGSITKPMMAMAVLQLAEQGVVDLDEDINTYLRRAQVPTDYPEPVTLRHLLTHTAGFDGDMSFSSVGPPGTATSLPNAVIQRRLHRVRAPGQVAAYDVLGHGIVGLVLEEVTGQPLSEVLKSRVFQPLGMAGAVVGVPPEHLGDLARCHISTQPGNARTCEHAALSELFQGSGAVAASAADMAAFMKALLHGSAWNDSRVLQAESFAELADFDHYRFHPSWRGLGLGIHEFEYAGRPAFGHGGGIQGFKNNMDLFPESGVGVYYGVNGGSEQVYDARFSLLPRLVPKPVPAEVQKAEAQLWRFTSLFAERFLPNPAAWEAPASDFASIDPDDVQGFYLHVRFVSDNILINLSRLSLATEVKAVGASLWLDGNGPYTQTRPALFESEDGRRVAFRIRDRSVWISFGREPFATYERVSWFARPVFSVLPLIPSLVLLFSGSVYLSRRFAGVRRRGAFLWLAGSILFLFGLVLELEYGVLSREIRGEFLLPLMWKLSSWLSVVMFAAALMVAPPWNWKAAGDAARWVQRTHSGLMGLAGLYLIVFSFFWKLVP